MDFHCNAWAAKNEYRAFLSGSAFFVVYKSPLPVVEGKYLCSMSQLNQPEIWLRGAIPGIPLLLQPVAHALLQAKEEIVVLLESFPEQLLWQRPAQVASVGFHLQHITGVLDRMYTYARGEALSPQQLAALAAEGNTDHTIMVSQLLQALVTQVDSFIAYLGNVEEHTLTEFRTVGRKQLPSSVMGLLFHAAEHTMRHTGQLLVTVQVLKGSAMAPPGSL
jgi:uncharacterized damage-inducible protein DinB